MEKKERAYIDVNAPREWERFFEEALENPLIKAQMKERGRKISYSGFGVWVIEQFLIENTSYRFYHINTKENRVTIKDRKLGHIFDIILKEPKEIWCSLCNRKDCEHISYALTIKEVKDAIKKKGWTLPEV